MTSQTLPLQGQVALVTGAARRIGRAIALHLAGLGADVAFTWNTSRDEAQEVEHELRRLGVRVTGVQADLRRSDQVRNVLAVVETLWGRLDVLINNAGRYEDAAFEEITDEQWDLMLDTNLKAPFLLSREAVPLLRRNGGGRIIHLASVGGVRAFPAHAHYCASKAGLIHLTHAMARALAPQIPVNAVAPGLITFHPHPTEWEQKMIERTPLRRAGTGEDIAQTVGFLATCSPYITGQVFVVDGGLALV